MGAKFDRVELRQATGVTKASVSDWFTGKTGALKGDTLVKAAAYLGVTPAWLGSGEGPKRRPMLFAETEAEAQLLTLFRQMDAEQRAATSSTGQSTAPRSCCRNTPPPSARRAPPAPSG
jgi:transcriptional regulator with XRE-family HTH domain